MSAELPSSRIKRRGLMLVISSPSGAGKSTLARNLLESDAGLELSVSVTTRARRPGRSRRHAPGFPFHMSQIKSCRAAACYQATAREHRVAACRLTSTFRVPRRRKVTCLLNALWRTGGGSCSAPF